MNKNNWLVITIRIQKNHDNDICLIKILIWNFDKKWCTDSVVHQTWIAFLDAIVDKASDFPDLSTDDVIVIRANDVGLVEVLGEEVCEVNARTFSELEMTYDWVNALQKALNYQQIVVHWTHFIVWVFLSHFHVFNL